MVVFGDSLLYALCYPEYESITYAQLYKFSIRDGSYEVLGDSIHFRSDEILTNANLFYNNVLQEFYCTVQVVNRDKSTNNRVYLLAYPGKSMQDLSIYDKNSLWFRFWYLAILSGCVVIIFIYWFIFRKKNATVVKKVCAGYFTEKEMDTNCLMQRRESGVYLFGEFTLYDKTGRDITYMLSTRLKNTFLLILEYSLTQEGITSHLLSSMLWSDKDEYSAKNLRGVTINQLRKILTELEGIKLIFDKGLYTLDIDDKCFCDCKYIMELMDLKLGNVHKFNEINNILSKGMFLKSTDDPVLEPFKLLMKEKLIANLPMYIEEAFRLNNDLLVVQLSDHLLAIDPLNVTVFSFQLRALYNLKQESDVRKRYALFLQNYSKLTNQSPQDLIELLNHTK
jgi:DNA-binding SARP family transcriptional activator